MNHRLKLTLISLTILTIAACHKKDALQKTSLIDVAVAQEWLHQNGLTYKNETINVKGPDGQILTGKLNWQKARQYPWEGSDYIDIPFEFAGRGKLIQGNEEVAPAAFNLVLRKGAGNNFEGAVRTTMHLEHQSSGNSIKKLQSYQLLDGQPANIWMSKGPERKLLATRRLNIDPVLAANRYLEYLGKKKLPVTGTGAAHLMVEAPIECPPIPVTTYNTICWEQNNDPMDVACTSVPVTEYIADPTCSSSNNPLPPPPTGGSGGSPTNPTYPPDPEEEKEVEDLPVLEDPCAEAKAGSEKATVLSNQSKFNDAKSDIKGLSSDGKEHAVSFGRDANGDITKSAASTGTGHNAPVPNITGQFADLHNHPENKPPSSGDIYGFIDVAGSKGSGYQRFITLPNETLYALIITDMKAATEFNKKYPRIESTGGYEPRFPENMVDELIDLEYYAKGEDNGLAFFLDKYNAGIALLKQDASGVFKRINVVYVGKDQYGSDQYNVSPCDIK